MYQNTKIIKNLYDNTDRSFQNLMFSTHGLYKRYQRNRLKNIVESFEKSQYFGEAKIKRHQFTKIRKLLHHCYANVPYYRNLFDYNKIKPEDIKSFDDFHMIPQLDKELIISNHQDLIASNSYIYHPIKQNTGGTTGTSLEFLLDLNCYRLREVELLRFFKWHNYNPDFDRTIVIRGNVLVPANQSSKEPWRYDYFRNTVYFSSYYLNDETMFEYYHFIRKWKPSFIRAYPSAIVTFARFLSANNLTLAVNKIFTASENLSESYRLDIQKAIDCKIIDHYGHGEPGCFAAGQCENGFYRIPAENVYVEVDSDGQIIETSLNNYSMPFIRYKIGDIVDGLTYNSNHEIKLPYFKRVFGRNDDFIITPSGQKIGRLDQIVKGARVNKCQIIQNKIDELSILIVPFSNYTSEDEEIIIQNLNERLGTEMEFKIKLVKDIKLEKSGKYRFVKCLLTTGARINQ